MHIIIFFIFTQQQLAEADGILLPALRQYLLVGCYTNDSSKSKSLMKKFNKLNFSLTHFALPVLILPILLSFTSCNSSQKPNSLASDTTKELTVLDTSKAILDALQPITIDTSNYVLLTHDTNYVLQTLTEIENGKSFVPSQKEIKKIEDILNNCIVNYNKLALHRLDSFYTNYPNRSLLKHNQVIINIHTYKLQCQAWIKKNGQKEVSINGFCNDPCDDKNRWRKSYVHNLDGTTCHFIVTINLTQENCGELYTMGTDERPPSESPCY